jgi:hypothetical protein
MFPSTWPLADPNSRQRLFVTAESRVIEDGGMRLPPAGTPDRARAAIALIGLKFALQTDGGKPYDTVPDENALRCAINHGCPHVGDARVGDGQADVRSAFDSTFDLVERAKSGDHDALNQLFGRYLAPLRRWAAAAFHAGPAI